MDSELPEHTGLTKLIGRPTDHSWKLDAEEKMRRLAEMEGAKIMEEASPGEALRSLDLIEQAQRALAEVEWKTDDTTYVMGSAPAQLVAQMIERGKDFPVIEMHNVPIVYDMDCPPGTTHYIEKDKIYLGPEAEKTFEVSETGGRKETKLARYSLIPGRALRALAEVYGRGAHKYADHNWRRGYKWSASHDALLRHIQAFWDGEDYDSESGQHHLSHAAWHCFTLFIFSTVSRFDRFDDRFDEEEGELFNSDVVG